MRIFCNTQCVLVAYSLNQTMTWKMSLFIDYPEAGFRVSKATESNASAQF